MVEPADRWGACGQLEWEVVELSDHWRVRERLEWEVVEPADRWGCELLWRRAVEVGDV